MSYTKEINKKKANFEFNKEFISVFSNKIKQRYLFFDSNVMDSVQHYAGYPFISLIAKLSFGTISIMSPTTP